MRILLIISTITFHTALFGQSTFRVISKEGTQPLIGATAAIWSESSNASEWIISDENGFFKTGLSFPLEAEIRHVGYRNVRVKIDNQRHVIALEIEAQSLEQVVVTGQFQPQSAKNSVYRVRTIGSDRLNQQAATDLFDVLSSELNLNLSRDNATGRTSISMQGLGGQYVKVLLDGVPMTGRSGVGNDIDLGQINVSEVARIEMVEGPMAVNYGADALAGVINIITKKDIERRFELSAALQEETIGKEYSWFNHGLHTPSVRLGVKINEKWYSQVNGRLLRSGGWKGNSTGRTHDWYPKKQAMCSWLTRFELENFNIYYRLDYLKETLENLGVKNDNNPLIDAFAIDEEYLSDRWSLQLQSEWEVPWATLNTIFSFNDYSRTTHQFSRNLLTNQKTTTLSTEQETLFYKTFFTRQTLNQLMEGDWGSVQLGTELTHDIAGGTTLSEGNKAQTDLGFFVASEVLLGKTLKVRPGLRWTRNSIFQTSPTFSVNVSYNVTPSLTWRSSYGRGFRAPSLRELHHEFINANHNILGNPNLEPEYSHSLNTDISYEWQELPLTLNASAFLNDFDNLITFFTPEGTSNQATSYTNLLKYQTKGLSLTGSTKFFDVDLHGGFSFIGQYQRLSESEVIPEFTYQFQFNAQTTYRIKALENLQVAAFYKFNGANKSYLLDAEGTPALRKVESFHLFDLTLSKSFYSGLSLSAGSRNVLDVTNVNNSLPGGAHGGGEQTPVLNGRSYFLQIRYELKY
ncbi:MAG: TonB-dependent receptor [Cytophagales bacterium]|nr:TonB-dependent receptor [Cytophagales bacterium]